MYLSLETKLAFNISIGFELAYGKSVSQKRENGALGGTPIANFIKFRGKVYLLSAFPYYLSSQIDTNLSKQVEGKKEGIREIGY